MAESASSDVSQSTRSGPNWASTTSRPPPLPDSTAHRSTGATRRSSSIRCSAMPPGSRVAPGSWRATVRSWVSSRVASAYGCGASTVEPRRRCTECTNAADRPAMASHSRTDNRYVGSSEQPVVEAGQGEQPGRDREQDERLPQPPGERGQDHRHGQVRQQRARRRARVGGQGARAERGDDDLGQPAQRRQQRVPRGRERRQRGHREQPDPDQRPGVLGRRQHQHRDEQQQRQPEHPADALGGVRDRQRRPSVGAAAPHRAGVLTGEGFSGRLRRFRRRTPSRPRLASPSVTVSACR